MAAPHVLHQGQAEPRWILLRVPAVRPTQPAVRGPRAEGGAAPAGRASQHAVAEELRRLPDELPGRLRPQPEPALVQDEGADAAHPREAHEGALPPRLRRLRVFDHERPAAPHREMGNGRLFTIRRTQWNLQNH
eukprot:gene5812-biopygen11770